VKVEQVGIFFDRDGTLNTEVDFLSRPEELELIPRSARAIREANEFGVKVFIITNQSGIARSLFSEADLAAVHKRLLTLLAREGAHVDGIYFCPHHPDYGTPRYRKLCSCRKPKPGMLRKAVKEHAVRLRDSFVIGDRCVDMEAGKAVGCRTAMVLTGYGSVEHDECLENGKVDFVARDAFEAWRFVKGTLAGRLRSKSH
jgi:D-glycero-D-manno-heptose 1,7-bisphosphate phosphatase